jgi:hypothetical protein
MRGAFYMDQTKNKEDLYQEAKTMHQMLHEQLQALQEKPFLTPQEEQEVKVLKKKKLHYKDMMESLREK